MFFFYPVGPWSLLIYPAGSWVSTRAFGTPKASKMSKLAPQPPTWILKHPKIHQNRIRFPTSGKSGPQIPGLKPHCPSPAEWGVAIWIYSLALWPLACKKEYIHACMYLFIMYVCMCKYIYIYIYTHACICICMHTYDMHACACMHACMYVCMYVCVLCAFVDVAIQVWRPLVL